MEYKLLNKRAEGRSKFWESVNIDEKFSTHVQVETRNGLVFMRAKKRRNRLH